MNLLDKPESEGLLATVAGIKKTVYQLQHIQLTNSGFRDNDQNR